MVRGVIQAGYQHNTTHAGIHTISLPILFPPVNDISMQVQVVSVCTHSLFLYVARERFHSDFANDAAMSLSGKNGQYRMPFCVGLRFV